jgi:hypothetical protein
MIAQSFASFELIKANLTPESRHNRDDERRKFAHDEPRHPNVLVSAGPALT